jgi:ABC-2 type transport system permease protein
MLTRPMEIAASCNPVTYIMEALRTLVLGHVDWGSVGLGFAVVAGLGVVMLALNLRMIRNYD